MRIQFHRNISAKNLVSQTHIRCGITRWNDADHLNSKTLNVTQKMPTHKIRCVYQFCINFAFDCNFTLVCYIDSVSVVSFTFNRTRLRVQTLIYNYIDSNDCSDRSTLWWYVHGKRVLYAGTLWIIVGCVIVVVVVFFGYFLNVRRICGSTHREKQQR